MANEMPAADTATIETAETVLDQPTDTTSQEAQPAAVDSILDLPTDDTPADKAQPDKQTADTPADEGEAKAYADMLAAVKDSDTLALGKTFDGNEVSLSAQDVRVLYPAMQKAGIPADKAKGVLDLFAQFRGAQVKLENEQYVKALNARADECRKVFGNDLPRVKTFAMKGINMIDKSLRDELFATKVLINDSRFLRFLADVGERFSVDNGGDASASGSDNAGGFDPATWVKTSQRN